VSAILGNHHAGGMHDAVERHHAEERSRTGLVASTIPFSNVDGPGNRFVVFLQGCNFDCAACHNPQTIPGHDPVDGEGPQRLSIDDLLADIRRATPFISGVTVSGGEATRQTAFLHALFAAVKTELGLAHLTCMVDSNGVCELGVWDDLAPVMDGAMIDLKCLDRVTHEEMTGQPNEQVLASIHHLHELDRLYEVRLLLIAGLNDDSDLLRRTAEWLASVDPRMRVKVIGFRPHGVRPHDPPLAEPTADSWRSAAAPLGAVAAFDFCIV
jgi:pyruvate formate lyase activating enzyme